MPRKILAIEFAIIYSNILNLPERVFRRYLCVMHLNVFAILEHILRVAYKPVNKDVLAEHERIGAFVKCDVLNLEILHLPESLVGIVESDVLNGNVIHLAEQFRSVYYCISHHHIVAVPDGGTRAHLKVAVGYQRAVNVPPGIFPNETASVGLDVCTAFNARLAFSYGDILESGIMNCKERSLASELFVAYYIHCSIIVFVCKDTTNNGEMTYLFNG